ncbi:hybrid sensor histidine kinase/response regulator [Halapricum hydrolyticum]|uniref:histidine kinase n=1 Tax=Halapricum hydrolyticum TaxID=2979991 RepID=A0AAE3IE01_9EURY|nr:ATP-binding protein [Halapricum hydrolyticum]MCU4719273.1 PAS domain-containing protein [Halapricum hydrolyticum]MCU4728542.1 PAS domain-containing protein [Halapricum hydrolyticum]
MGVEPSVGTLHALFVDPDGRIDSVIETLREYPDPIEVQSVPSVADAVETARAERVDLLVVLGALEAEHEPAIDGIDAYERARESLPETPVAVYDYNWDNERLKDAIERGIDTIKGVPEAPELVYRQLRSAAGMEVDPRTDSELLESLFEYYPHQLFLKDDVGRFEGASAATAREYDLARSEIVGLTDYDILDPETARQTYEEEQALLASGEPEIERIEHYVDDQGRDRWVSITKAPRYDEEGEPIGIVGSSRDVTEEKRKEYMVREVHAATEHLVRMESKAEIGRAAMGLTEDIPVVSRIQVVLSDDATGELEPLSIDDGDSLFETYRDRFEDVVETRQPRYLTTGGQAAGEFTDERDISIAILPLDDHGALGFAADADTFTEFGIDLANILASSLEAALDRAGRERELEEQNDRLEEFASIVSHDLRNPLNVASASAELLAEETDSEHVDRIENALERMERLIEALLTLARRGQVVGETEPVALEAVASDAWQVVDAPRATLTVDSTGTVVADRDRLVEALENLFRNAVEHGTGPDSQAPDDAVEGRADTTVRVGIRGDGNGFYVADGGDGIDPDIRERVFEMGYSQSPDGTGYGLYIVSTIAQAHGWSVEITDSKSGGARFDFTGVELQ